MKSIGIDELDTVKVGKRIKDLRNSLGISQTKLAELLGYSSHENVKGTISQWENGKASIPLDKLIRMSKLFDKSIDYILCKSDCDHVENKDITELTGLSDKSIETLRKNKREGDNRYIFILDLLLSDEEVFSELMENMCSLLYPTTWAFSKNDIPKPLLMNGDEEHIYITPEVLKQMSDDLPDNVFHRMRDIIERFQGKNKNVKMVHSNEYHPYKSEGR